MSLPPVGCSESLWDYLLSYLLPWIILASWVHKHFISLLLNMRWVLTASLCGLEPSSWPWIVSNVFLIHRVSLSSYLAYHNLSSSSSSIQIHPQVIEISLFPHDSLCWVNIQTSIWGSLREASLLPTHLGGHCMIAWYSSVIHTVIWLGTSPLFSLQKKRLSLPIRPSRLTCEWP